MTPPTTITLGGDEYSVERPSALKASRALALMRALSRAMPELTTELAEFRREYERANVLELDRVQARMRYPAEPLVRNGEPLTHPPTLEDGSPNPHAGELVLLPSPVDRMSEEDWQATGGIYRVPASPGWGEVIAALFDRALELAESHVYRLLALFTIPNDTLKAYRKAGTLDEEVARRAEALLDDAYADELLELAVVVGETVDHHFRRKVRDLGGFTGERMGNLLRLIGLTPTTTSSTPDPPGPTTSTDGPQTSRPSSSTDSPESTADGPPTSPSTPPSTSSSASDQSSTSATNGADSRTPATV